MSSTTPRNWRGSGTSKNKLATRKEPPTPPLQVSYMTYVTTVNSNHRVEIITAKCSIHRIVCSLVEGFSGPGEQVVVAVNQKLVEKWKYDNFKIKTYHGCTSLYNRECCSFLGGNSKFYKKPLLFDKQKYLLQLWDRSLQSPKVSRWAFKKSTWTKTFISNVAAGTNHSVPTCSVHLSKQNSKPFIICCSFDLFLLCPASNLVTVSSAMVFKSINNN